VIKPLLKVLNMLGAVVITFSNLLGSQPFWIVERGRFFALPLPCHGSAASTSEAMQLL